MVENRLKEEKTVLDLKMAHLEANLKAKSQQLQERIDQVNLANLLKYNIQ